ncbi:MAG: hypothetical protein MUC48_10075 [Leptolyngbya sp. Prado105]|jgi:hypothetical protein|nr:hypothetical protein [Leptolyngbya sp. Prado105]
MEIPSRFAIPESLSFEAAIELTQSLLSEVEQGHILEPELERIITALVQTENGARGFFVTYLSDEREWMDKITAHVVSGLLPAQDKVADLLTKNLAMSTAMIITHTRNQKLELVEGSAIVQRRTNALIRHMRSRDVDRRLMELKTSIAQKGEYSSFLDRWKYDADQRHAISRAVTDALLN